MRPTHSKKIILFLTLLLAPTIFSNVSAQQFGAFNAEAQQGTATGGVGHHFGIGFLYSYGFNEHVYEQYTGDKAFADGGPVEASIVDENCIVLNSIPCFPGNFNYEAIIPGANLGASFLGAISLGFEYAKFSATSKSIHPDKEDLIDLKLDMNLYVGELKFYFFDPLDIGGNGFIGLGYGILQGKFTGNNIKPGEFNATISQVHIGGDFSLGALGFRFEFRPIFADNVHVSEDPFNQSNEGDGIDINFSGIITVMAAYYRF